MLLEVACFHLKDAILAAEAGANRIELCRDYDVGGITPTQSDIEKARQQIQVPLYVMIRPFTTNFVYTDEEVEVMKKQILFCKQQKCEGVVFGILDAQNRVNKDQCKALVALASPMQCTFHRAFDEAPDPFEALEDIIACGFTRILSSGGRGNADRNIASLKELITKANNRIIIMPGGDVRSSNIKKIISDTGCKEIHTAAIDHLSRNLIVEEIHEMKKILSA